MSSGDESDLIYTRDKDGKPFKYRRTSRVTRDKNGDLHEVPKGHYPIKDKEGNIHTPKYFSSKKSRKLPPPFASQEDEELEIDDKDALDTPSRFSDRENLEQLYEEVIHPHPNQTPDD